MYRFCFLFAVLLLIGSTSFTQTAFPTYYSQSVFSLASPGSYKFGLYGFDNPALLPHLESFDAQFLWDDQSGKWNDFNRWGVFTGFTDVGFGLIHQRNGDHAITDYRLSYGIGNRTLSYGLAYGWATGDKTAYGRTNNATLGLLARPNRYVSIGAFGTAATSGTEKEAVADISLRPRGNEFVTIFADAALRNDQHLNDLGWSAGVVLEALPGVRITGRYFDSKAFNLGMEFSLGNSGVMSQAHYDKDQNHAYTTYGIRLGARDRSIVGTLVGKNRQYADFNLQGTIRYQRFKYLDNSTTLSDLLQQIKAAKEDSAVAGITINTSGFSTGMEMIWELREQLKDFKRSGKKVVIFLDRVDLPLYHFASIADKIVMDPLGTIMLQGVAMGRTYFKGTLEKLGIGFDEWRFFKYKSANEGYSREKMSDADREQRQKLVDDFYRLMKTDICESRNLTPDRLDQLLNDSVLFLPDQALHNGLVDTLARWDSIDDIVKEMEGKNMQRVNPGSLAAFQLPNDGRWSSPPVVAVIYAIGVCAMDEGITARTLINYINAAASSTDVKVVVLRVDSPGGDALASDYVAEALKKCMEKKPVIISQGSVAASGGYWVSMYSDMIVAAPNTITGSIGVIGGWFYNKGLKDTLGISTDIVQVGKHADLGFGFSLPLIGLGIPDRNLTGEERSKMELAIRTFYSQFVNKVAQGRKKQPSDIEPIAQGRVWSGYDGKQNGLVDVLGGLETAIQIAKERSGIASEDEVKIIELPPKGLIDLSFLQPKLFGISIEEDPALEQLRFRIEHNGEPMPMLPMDEYGTEEYR